MREEERLGIDDVGVSRQTKRTNLRRVSPQSLPSGEEKLTGEDFVDGSVFVRGRGGSAHELESGDSEGNMTAVETENDAAERSGVGARRGGGECGGGIGAEVSGTEGEIEEDAVGDCYVGGRNLRGRGDGGDCGGEEEVATADGSGENRRDENG